MSPNHHDFLDLHLVVEAAGGVHPGILIIRSDNDPSRDMTRRGVVAAIARMESSEAVSAGQFEIVNQWR